MSQNIDIVVFHQKKVLQNLIKSSILHLVVEFLEVSVASITANYRWCEKQ